MSIVGDAFEAHRRVLAEASSVLPPRIEAVAGMLACVFRAGGKLLTCGNGGSAADAQHVASELVGRLRHDRPAVAAIALTTDSSALTAIANDYGYAHVFARQIEALARRGDALLAISASGNSENVLAAARSARDLGCTVVALTGRDGGRLAPAADFVVGVPSDDVQRIQEIHELCLHALVERVEALLAAPAEGAP